MIHQELLASKYVWRKFKSKFILGLLFTLAIVALIPLFSLFYTVVEKGAPGLTLDFFTKLPASVGEEGGGMGHAIVGTLTLTMMACLLGVPWGIAVGVFFSEYSSHPLAKWLRFLCDILLSVPSVIIGLFGYALVVKPMGGFSAHAGAFSLSLILMPFVARSTEEILKMVPAHYREAGLGLGLSRWRVILKIVLRTSIGGVLTGVLLGVARIAGETAPLLFTAFGNQYWSRSLNEPIASLPLQVYQYAISPFEEWQNLAWTGALVLMVAVLCMNLFFRILTYKREG